MDVAVLILNCLGLPLVEEKCWVFKRNSNHQNIRVPIDILNLSELPTQMNCSGDVNSPDVVLFCHDNNNIKPQTSNALEEGNSSKQETGCAVWSAAATKLLLCEFKALRKLVDQRKIYSIKKIWPIIEEKMANNNYSFTAVQIESRWRTLERKYKSVIANNNKTGHANKTMLYYEEMQDILSSSPNIIPHFLKGVGVSRNQTQNKARAGISTACEIVPESTDNPESIHQRNNKENISPNMSKSPKDKTSRIIELLEKSAADRAKREARAEERHQEKMTILKELLQKK